MKLYYHPKSLLSQKVLIAFYEKGVHFVPEVINLTNSAIREAYTRLNPWGEIPTLLDDKGNLYREPSTIIEYLELENPGTNRLIPADPQKALFARYFDRAVALYLYNPLHQLLSEGRRTGQNEKVVSPSRMMLEKTYATLNKDLAAKEWLAGDDFSIADCAAAPTLVRLCTECSFEKYEHLRAYFGRLQSRHSVTRVQKEAGELPEPVALLLRTSWSGPLRPRNMSPEFNTYSRR